MNYCVIAVRDNYKFRSIFCRCKEDLLSVLLENHHSIEQAKSLIDQGDICQLSSQGVRHYAKDWGFNWKTAQPTEFEAPKDLFDYVRAAGIGTVYLFERNEWRKVESAVQGQNTDRAVA